MKFFCEKNGKQYAVSECSAHWSVELVVDSLTVSFRVSKEICADEAAIREYIKTEKMF